MCILYNIEVAIMYFYLDSVINKIKLFAKNETGSIAMMGGPILLVLLVAAGGTIDYARGYGAKKEIANALDVAILAAGASQGASEADIIAKAQQYFDANISQKTKEKVNPVITVNVEENSIEATVNADLSTTFLGLTSMEKISIDTTAKIDRTQSFIEVALVLDNTGSMNSNGKLDALKLASKELVTTLFAPEGSEHYVKMSLVPFSGSVNVGTNENRFWIDMFGNGRTSREDFPNRFQEPVQAYYNTFWQGGPTIRSGARNTEFLEEFDVQWNGCLRERIGSLRNEFNEWVDLDLSDFTPVEGKRHSLFPRMIRPARGWKEGEDPTESEVTERIEDSRDCPPQEVIKLTNDAEKLERGINAMETNGYTLIPVGLAWGRRVLSPNKPFSQGASYDDVRTKKIIVLLTDGQNSAGTYYDDWTRGRYTAYGMPVAGHLGTGEHKQILNDKTQNLCEDLKTQNNIYIYVITFQLGNDTATKDLMRNCATREDMYFDSPSNESLKDAFRQIGAGLTSLRLTH